MALDQCLGVGGGWFNGNGGGGDLSESENNGGMEPEAPGSAAESGPGVSEIPPPVAPVPPPVPAPAAEHPRAGLLLLGSSPHPEVLAYGERDGVLIPGTVPDPATYLASCRVMALPLRVCSGFRTRAVETMATSLPIVAYPEAMAGLKVEPGTEWVSVEGPEQMADSLLDLLRDTKRAQEIGRRGREAVNRSPPRWLFL